MNGHNFPYECAAELPPDISTMDYTMMQFVVACKKKEKCTFTAFLRNIAN